MKRDILWLSCLLILCIVVFCVQHALKKGPHPASTLDALEQELLAGNDDSYDAYRKLVHHGEPGWAIICKHEFDIRPETDHLRAGFELGDSDQAELFWEYQQDQFKRMLENEDRTMAYAHSMWRIVCKKSRPYEVVIDGMFARLSSHLSAPRKARFEIALLRVSCEKNFQYPWNGTDEAQRIAIKRWMEYRDTRRQQALAVFRDAWGDCSGVAGPRGRPKDCWIAEIDAEDRLEALLWAKRNHAWIKEVVLQDRRSLSFRNRLLELIFRTAGGDVSELARKFLDDKPYFASPAAVAYLLRQEDTQALQCAATQLEKHPGSYEWLMAMQEYGEDHIPSKLWEFLVEDGAQWHRKDELNELTRVVLAQLKR